MNTIANLSVYAEHRHGYTTDEGKHTSTFKSPVTARYIRLYAHTCVGWVSLRAAPIILETTRWFTPGSKVTAKHANGGWHPATVATVPLNGERYTVSWDDGDTTGRRVAAHNIRGVRAGPRTKWPYRPSGVWKVRITRPLSLGTANDAHHLHVGSLEVWDQANAKLQLAYTGRASEYVKRGVDGGKTPADLIDGDPKTGQLNDWGANTVYGSQDHWMEFEVPKTVFDRGGGETTIVVGNHYNNPARLAGATLAVLDFDGTTMAEFTLTADMVQRFQLLFWGV